MGSGATYVVRVVGSDASRIDVNGPATINGSTFEAMVGSPAQFAAVGQRYTVLTASDGVGGQFGAVTGNLGSAASQYPFPTRILAIRPTRSSLDLVRSGIPFVAAAQSPNEYGVATGLDTMNPLAPGFSRCGLAQFRDRARRLQRPGRRPAFVACGPIWSRTPMISAAADLST